MATTWNPSDKTAQVTLSAANLTATGVGATNSDVRTIAYGGASALLYCEIVLVEAGSTTGNAVGFANSTFAVGTDDSSASPNAITAWTDGQVYMNNGSTPVGAWAGVSAQTDGEVVSVAIDTANKKFWARLDSGNWNNNGSADPATNTGGYSITNAGPYTVIGGFGDAGSGGIGTLRKAQLSIPSGFTDMMAAARGGLLTLGVG